MVELTADEAAVYDRQLRVWGLETQQRWGDWATHIVVTFVMMIYNWWYHSFTNFVAGWGNLKCWLWAALGWLLR